MLTLSLAMAGGCFRTSLTVCITVSVLIALTERTSSTNNSCSSLAAGITWSHKLTHKRHLTMFKVYLKCKLPFKYKQHKNKYTGLRTVSFSLTLFLTGVFTCFRSFQTYAIAAMKWAPWFMEIGPSSSSICCRRFFEQSHEKGSGWGLHNCFQ